MKHLENVKTVLEIILLLFFLVLGIHLLRTRGHEHTFSLLTNKP